MENEQMLAEIKSVMSEMQKKYDEGKTSEGDRLNGVISDLESKMEAIEIAQKRSDVEAITEEAKEAGYAAEFKNWAISGDATEVKAAEWNTLTPESAGVMVPEAVLAKIVELRDGANAMRRLANREVITTSNQYKFNNQTSEAQAVWGAETVARGTTDVQDYARGVINLHSLHVEPKITVEQLQDTPNAEMWLSKATGRAVAKLENAGFVSGTGDANMQPTGILSYVGATAAHNVIEEITSNGATVESDDLIDLIYAIDPYYSAGAKFLMSRATLSAFRKLKDSNGKYMVDVTTQMDGRGLITTLNQVQVELDDNMPSIATGAVPVLFGNFGEAYTIVDKGGVRAIRDDVTDKSYVKFFQEFRTGGGLVDGHAVKALKMQ